MAGELRLSRESLEAAFVKKVEELSGQNPYACYQCGKCSAGCLFAEHMDFLPGGIPVSVEVYDAQGNLVRRLEAKVVVGLGNPDRADEGVGIAVVEGLSPRPDLEVFASVKTGLDLAMALLPYERVLLVDAAPFRPVGEVVERWLAS